MSPTSQQLRQGFRLGDRLVRPALNRIRGPGGETRIEPRVMEVLVCLAEHAGEVVSRDDLYERVWPDTVVTDQAITNCISELRHHLGDDRASPRFIQTVPKRGYRLVAAVETAGADLSDTATPGRPRDRDSSWRAPLVAGVGLVAGALVLILWWIAWPGHATGTTPVVVLPFKNSAGEENLDYLKLALPDEITTVLTRARGLAVRPFEATPYDSPDEAAGQRNAVNVVIGRFYREGNDRLTVAIEAQNVDRDRLIWHARVTVPAGESLELAERIAGRIRGGLLPALGVRAEHAPSVPSDSQAYQLYLRSLAVSRDPANNPRGIGILEDVVERDPAYAPAWASLARRYHDHYAYGGGGDSALAKAREAAERALELDPGLVDAARRLVSLETESGRLESAYRRARNLVDRRTDSGDAHFALAYVLRYGGMLSASRRHCEMALDLDPNNPGWRSCAFAYMAAGQLERAPRFVDLDSGSYWANLVSVHYWIRRGDMQKARQYAQRLEPGSVERRFHEACLDSRPGRTPDEAARPFIEKWGSLRDPEPSYWIGSLMVYCGRPEDAINLLESAVNDGYCAYPAVDEDPAWQALHDNPAFREVRERAEACHRRFSKAVDNRPS